MITRVDIMETRSPIYSWSLLRSLLLITIAAMLVNGCTVKRPVSIPSPDYPDSRPLPGEPPTIEPEPRVYTPTFGPAESLYHSAKKSLASGDTKKAELTMERALRIEPRNSHYWYTMAQIKYNQRQYGQTIQLCLKSKSLAGRNRQLVALNDELMARARSMQ